MRKVLSIMSTAAVLLGGPAAKGSELPAFEKSGFPITWFQMSVLGSDVVQETSPIPALTIAGMPASPHQVVVLTPRQKTTERAASAGSK